MEFYRVTFFTAPGERKVSDRYFKSYEEVGRYLISISHCSGMFESVAIYPCCFYFDPEGDEYVES